MRLLYLLRACVLVLPLWGQTLDRSVIGSAGDYFSSDEVGDLHWTLGEVAVERDFNRLTLSRGFHQSNPSLLISSIWSAPEIQLELTAFPNPTAGNLTLRGDWKWEDRVMITDLLGKTLLQQELPLERAELNLTAYPAGTYLLTISRAGQPLRTLRIVRQ